jgi:hypothetical protein
MHASGRLVKVLAGTAVYCLAIGIAGGLAVCCLAAEALSMVFAKPALHWS